VNIRGKLVEDAGMKLKYVLGRVWHVFCSVLT
jgi:hypothetical protein